MTNFRKALIVAATSVALVGSQAMAADLSLAPGKPAGVHEAQRGRTNLWLIGGAVAVVAVVGIVVATQSGNDAACGAACTPATPTTTS